MTDAILDGDSDLKALDEVIWRQVQSTYAGRPTSFGERVRKLTPEEWAMVQVAVHTGKYIVQPVNCSLGFGFGLKLYEIPVDPSYPGVTRDPPTLVLFLEGGHLPEGLDDSFDGSWAIMSPLSHNEANGKRLREYLGEELRDKERYEY